MFAFVTISNGLAVVQHAPTGCIYRFRPTRPGVWNRLTLQAVDGEDDGAPPSEHEGAARQFAEAVAASCCDMTAPSVQPDRPSRLRRRFSFGTLRPLGQA